MILLPAIIKSFDFCFVRNCTLGFNEQENNKYLLFDENLFSFRLISTPHLLLYLIAIVNFLNKAFASVMFIGGEYLLSIA